MTCVVGFARSGSAQRTACDDDLVSDPSIPDDVAVAERETAAEHVGEIMFDSLGRLDRECLLCQVAARLGLWGRFGEVDGEGWPVVEPYELACGYCGATEDLGGRCSRPSGRAHWPAGFEGSPVCPPCRGLFETGEAQRILSAGGELPLCTHGAFGWVIFTTPDEREDIESESASFPSRIAAAEAMTVRAWELARELAGSAG
jgi:hypothetical protein